MDGLLAIAARLLNWLGFSSQRLTPRPSLIATLGLLVPNPGNIELVRAGGPNDGGYLIPNDLVGVDAILSPGVENTASFENFMLARGLVCHLADASVAGPPLNHENITFTKKFIGPRFLGSDFLPLSEWVESCVPESAKELILQMDIEGGEYAALSEVSSTLLSRFRIMVLELHHLGAIETPAGEELIRSLLLKLRESHQLVHIHGNNSSRLLSPYGLSFYDCMELTFLRKDRVALQKNSDKAFLHVLPHELDRRNVLHRRDVAMSFAMNPEVLEEARNS